MECNRRLAELREEVAMFLGQTAEEYVYWVRALRQNATQPRAERRARGRRGIFAARLFQSDTSVIMTSATLATSVGQASRLSPSKKERKKINQRQPKCPSCLLHL